MVDAHQTGAVRKYGFDLQQVDHVGDALHDIAFFQYAGRPFHNLFHGLAFTRALQCRGRDIGYGLRIIQFQPFFIRRSAIMPSESSINLSISFGVKCIVNDFYD